MALPSLSPYSYYEQDADLLAGVTEILCFAHYDKPVVPFIALPMGEVTKWRARCSNRAGFTMNHKIYVMAWTEKEASN